MSLYVIVPAFPDDEANQKLYEIFKDAAQTAKVEFKNAVKMGYIEAERAVEPLFNSIVSADLGPETVWELTVPLSANGKKALSELGFKVSDTAPPQMKAVP